ncbi:leucyl aminopeptidase [uncultured Gimesia sp.]|uniref:leucyl aminopeptidase n=1 Tax=uncultured Gimesia sp. TaxID=1678688 RepID=UPI0030DDC56A|tara:strand:- start:51858 stop:53357 length:1500 start_codon:yes stop_codon:yes gene_type:complete
MGTQFTNESISSLSADWLVIGLAESAPLSTTVAQLDKTLNGLISRLIESEDFTGKLATTSSLLGLTEIKTPRILLVGLGPDAEVSLASLEKAMMTAARTISAKQNTTAAALLPELENKTLSTEQIACVVTSAMNVGSVGQDLYRKEAARFPFQELLIVGTDAIDQSAGQQAVERGTILGDSINLAREMVNRHAGDIFPITFADRVVEVAKEYGLDSEILDEKQLKQEKMGSMLAVAQGSDQPARLAILKHAGADPSAPTLALVGKGVTFDSGGLSLKLGDGMKTMKCDMGGAAAVLGAMTAIARLKLPVNVIGYMGLVENMVNGSSYKLGDVLTARNGKTIEVLNTDAEGRLVLADVLTFAVDRGASNVIDLATLTGACVVALGEEITGVFSNNADWSKAVQHAAQNSGEDVWEMPMLPQFGEQLKSDVADLKNIGTRWGGAITAAKFLENFINETPWVHLDIAGPAFAAANLPHREGGGTGCMVKTLVEVAGQYPSSK